MYLITPFPYLSSLSLTFLFSSSPLDSLPITFRSFPPSCPVLPSLPLSLFLFHSLFSLPFSSLLPFTLLLHLFALFYFPSICHLSPPLSFSSSIFPSCLFFLPLELEEGVVVVMLTVLQRRVGDAYVLDVGYYCVISRQ